MRQAQMEDAQRRYNEMKKKRAEAVKEQQVAYEAKRQIISERKKDMSAKQ